MRGVKDVTFGKLRCVDQGRCGALRGVKDVTFGKLRCVDQA